MDRKKAKWKKMEKSPQKKKEEKGSITLGAGDEILLRKKLPGGGSGAESFDGIYFSTL